MTWFILLKKVNSHKKITYGVLSFYGEQDASFERFDVDYAGCVAAVFKVPVNVAN